MMKKNNSNDQIAERIIQLMQRDVSVDAPHDSIKWAKNIFRTRMADSKAPMVRRVLAALRMDLAPNRAAFGERSGTGGQARQMLFDAGDNSIDLRIKEADGAREIHGQVMGEGFAGGTVELFNTGASHKATASEMSEFKLAGVAPGVYSFAVTSGEKELLIEGLDLN